MSIIDCKETTPFADIFKDATSILTLLLFGSRTHEGGDIHFDILDHEGGLFLVSLLGLLLLLAFALAENA